jgi:hydrogenase maturation protease
MEEGSETRPSISVVGIGSRERGDDAVGFAVVQALRGTVPGMEILEHDGEGVDLIAGWKDRRTVFLVDAVVSGSAPGAIRRVDLIRERLAMSVRGLSSHRIGVVQVIELARTLGSLPSELVLYGVEGESFRPGDGLSPAVRAAVPRVVRAIQDDLHASLRLTPLN